MGVILAAGEGQRMGEISAHFAKPVLPVCNEPLIAGHLRLLTGLGLNRVVVVVGYRKATVEATARACCPRGLHLEFVEQPERLGIAHALNLARPLVNGSNLVVVLGDTYFIPQDLDRGLALLCAPGPDQAACVLSVRRVKDPEMIRRECTVRFDAEDRLLEIREKPHAAFNDLKPCGIYFFSPAIFDAIEMTPLSALRGEVEITDSIQTLAELGHKVTWAPTIFWDRNINYPGDILMSNLVELRRRGLSQLLGERVQLHEEARLAETVVGNDVRIDAPAHFLRSLVLDGSVVEAHGDYTDCVVGPRFAVADCLQDEWADVPDA
jgi:glucose-1-phosphate thymidylyltransferase